MAAFPRYISYIHAACSEIGDRQILLANLFDEEHGEENHPELWLRFAEGLGVSREESRRPAALLATTNLVEGYFDLVKPDYAVGLGALYAYERQTPEVSQSKIEGLKKHYCIEDFSALQFFVVHKEADEWHTAEIVGLIKRLDQYQQKAVINGATKGPQLLWSFLDGMMSICGYI